MTCRGSCPATWSMMCCGPVIPGGITIPLGSMKLIGNRDIHTIPLLSGSSWTSTQSTFSSVQNSWYLSPCGRTYSMYGRSNRFRLRWSILYRIGWK